MALYVKGGENANDVAGYFDGDVYATDVVIGSDERLKENVQDIGNALSLLNQLQPKKYKYRQGTRRNSTDSKTHYGFIAQEMEGVLPDVVSDVYHPAVYEYVDHALDSVLQTVGDVVDGINPLAPMIESDITGITRKEIKGAETLKAIRYIDLIAVLTQAVKEQQIEIEGLKQQQKSSRPQPSISPEIKTIIKENARLQESFNKLKSSFKELSQRVDLMEQCTGCATNKGEQKKLKKRKNTVKIFPNPARNEITVKNSANRRTNIRVLTIDGQLFKTLDNTSRMTRINTSDWPAGTYIFRITKDGALVDQQQIIIAR